MARLLLGALPRSAQFCLSPTLIQVRHAQKRKKPIDFYSLKALEVQSAISEEFELPRMMLRQAKGGGSGKAKPGFLVSDVSGQFVVCYNDVVFLAPCIPYFPQ